MRLWFPQSVWWRDDSLHLGLLLVVIAEESSATSGRQAAVCHPGSASAANQNELDYVHYKKKKEKKMTLRAIDLYRCSTWRCVRTCHPSHTPVCRRNRVCPFLIRSSAGPLWVGGSEGTPDNWKFGLSARPLAHLHNCFFFVCV